MNEEYTVAETTLPARFQVSKCTVARWRREGKLIGGIRKGYGYFYTEEQISAFIDNNPNIPGLNRKFIQKKSDSNTSAIQTGTITVNGMMLDLRELIMQISDKIDALQHPVKEIVDSPETIAQLGDALEIQQQLKEQLDNANKSVTTLSNKIAVITKDNDNLTEQLQSVQNDYTILDKTYKELKKQFDQLLVRFRKQSDDFDDMCENKVLDEPIDSSDTEVINNYLDDSQQDSIEPMEKFSLDNLERVEANKKPSAYMDGDRFIPIDNAILYLNRKLQMKVDYKSQDEQLKWIEQLIKGGVMVYKDYKDNIMVSMIGLENNLSKIKGGYNG